MKKSAIVIGRCTIGPILRIAKEKMKREIVALGL